ncbi:hypothetical protein LX16_3106 [Stackebrandtia albiflava]|uniref:Uncharacterized protein n=1 Tax=Stackebrandtia albiflava TaxID=406432 RepID=A0A562V367_9ACTN|nr:hypothetical protein [Stackebrandtia albiflava]TWJ12349.1 hypothetical protein LX16_3106 [Stackebrandtia albiflava]
MESSDTVASAAARHPADPEPVPSTKAAAAYALGIVAVVTSPFVGGVIPALLALRIATQADAEIAHSEGFLLGAAKSRRARRLAWIAVAVACFVVAAWLVWWIFQLAVDAGRG